VITVLIATRNGERWLPACLSSFRKLERPFGGWRLVVVDNGSTDRTAEIIRRFGDLPIHYAFQSKPGKNAALNLGLQYIEGDVAFTDDDVLPNPDWLVRLAEAADTANNCDIIGGQIVPVWPSEPPNWIKSWVPMGPVYAATDPAWPEGPCTLRSVWGPNMLVRNSVFRQGYRFDETVGPNGTVNYRMGSEISFTQRLANDGARFWHARRACVGHMIRPEQLTREWILGRAFRYGRFMYQDRPNVPRLLGYPRYAMRQLIEIACQNIAAQISGDEGRKFVAAWNLRQQLGFLSESRVPRNSTSCAP
jgi:glycosyltransferase involved in cell wall biosynthesis